MVLTFQCSTKLWRVVCWLLSPGTPPRGYPLKQEHEHSISRTLHRYKIGLSYYGLLYSKPGICQEANKSIINRKKAKGRTYVFFIVNLAFSWSNQTQHKKQELRTEHTSPDGATHTGEHVQQSSLNFVTRCFLHYSSYTRLRKCWKYQS